MRADFFSFLHSNWRNWFFTKKRSKTKIFCAIRKYIVDMFYFPIFLKIGWFFIFSVFHFVDIRVWKIKRSNPLETIVFSPSKLTNIRYIHRVWLNSFRLEIFYILHSNKKNNKSIYNKKICAFTDYILSHHLLSNCLMGMSWFF